MKKLLIAALSLFFLTGCAAQETFETVDDALLEPVAAPVEQQIHLSLPDEAISPTMDNGQGGKIYLCDGYTITVQTLPTGDLDRTVRELTGFSPETLHPMETVQDGAVRYDCAWSAAGEGGDQVFRCTILDDGNYHYAVTVTAPAQSAGDLTQTWQTLLGSIALISTD